MQFVTYIHIYVYIHNYFLTAGQAVCNLRRMMMSLLTYDEQIVYDAWPTSITYISSVFGMPSTRIVRHKFGQNCVTLRAFRLRHVET